MCKKKIHLNSTYLIHDNKTTWNKQNKLHRQNIKYYVIRNPLLAMLNDEILVKEIIFYTLYNLDLIYH